MNIIALIYGYFKEYYHVTMRDEIGACHKLL